MRLYFSRPPLLKPLAFVKAAGFHHSQKICGFVSAARSCQSRSPLLKPLASVKAARNCQSRHV
jgi:hypothetical protein